MSSSKMIKVARRKKGLTQKKLAELCEVGQSYISHWERGDFLPSPKLVSKVADQLGIDCKILAESVEDEKRRERLARYDAEEAGKSALGISEETGKIPENPIVINSGYAWRMLKYFTELPEELQIAELERLRLMTLGYMLDKGKISVAFPSDKHKGVSKSNDRDDPE